MKVLAKAIGDFSDSLKEIEEKKIAVLNDRIEVIEKWRDQLKGGWKLAVILWTVLGAAISAGIIAAVKAFFK